jgi:catechol 2,3-dioxygenase-like lactoylglutathione lyase family enzyme
MPSWTHHPAVFGWLIAWLSSLAMLPACVAPGGQEERRETVTDLEAQITFCFTANLEATARFYEEVLGLPLALDQGSCRIYRTAAGAYLGFCERKEGASPEGVILTLVTDDVDGWYERLSRRGVEFEKKPTHNPKYRIYHCFLRDPDGYLIEIQRFEDPRWNAGDRESRQ